MSKCHCRKRAFNVIGEKNGKFCSKHKEPDMVDVIHKQKQEQREKKLIEYIIYSMKHPLQIIMPFQMLSIYFMMIMIL